MNAGWSGATPTKCREVEQIIWTEGPEAAPQAHVNECASCSAETRRAADLQAALSGMRSRFAMAPVGLESRIVAAVNRTRIDRARDIVSHPKFWRGAAVGAAAAAAAATAAIGVMRARRRVAAATAVPATAAEVA
jgi:hypothetical protein